MKIPTPLSAPLKQLRLACLMLVAVLSASAQTYKVGSASPASSSQAKPAAPKAKTAAATTESQKPANQMGWGSNIQNARLAGAAQEALRNGKYSAAADFAQRAVQAAPNDPQLWFLLGYCARLANRFQLSVDAYNHGLGLKPGSVEGLSGLAQTYSRMGRRDEAQRLLTQVLDMDPAPRRRCPVAGRGLHAAGPI